MKTDPIKEKLVEIVRRWPNIYPQAAFYQAMFETGERDEFKLRGAMWDLLANDDRIDFTPERTLVPVKHGRNGQRG